MSKQLRMIGIGIFVALVVGIFGIVMVNATSSPPRGVGISGGSSTPEQLAPCPDSPNCVSTNAAEKNQAIDPLPLAETTQQTLELLESAVGEVPGGEQVAQTRNYLHFEFRSPLLRFVDDVEFLIDADRQQVHVRSASRIGRSDFGVNRRRMESIRERYAAALQRLEASTEQTVVTTESGGAVMADKTGELEVIEKSDDQWKQQLTAEQFHVTRKHGTERAFTGPNWDNKDPGIYSCVCCGLPLFSSETKYESGTGWPSFWDPINETNVETQVDVSFFMRRTEVHCRRCKAHLGHVFTDGPEPTGLRYCMNGVAMEFEPAERAGSEDAASSDQPETDSPVR